MATAFKFVEARAGSDSAAPPVFAATPKAYRRLQFYAGLLAGDIAAAALGFWTAWSARFDHAMDDRAGQILFALLPMFAVIAFHRGAYGVEALRRWQFGLRRSLTALVLAALVVAAIGFAWKVSSDYSRLYALLGVAISAIFITASRFAIKLAVERRMPGSPLEEIILTDGCSVECAPHQRLVSARALGVRPDLDCPETLDRLGRALRHADRVLIACEPAQRQAWTWALKGVGVKVEVLIPEIEQLGVLEIDRHGDRLTAIVARGQLSTAQRVLKRLFDLGVVLWMLPVLLTATAIVALLIKLDDGGPVFFVQKRIGQGNRLFRMYKFRSMRSDRLDRDGRRSTARGDARITRVGALLRSTSIDELPQLFNVLLGNMSIVGPRPHATGSTAGDQLFWAVDRRYWLRHAAKPGLTGLAQVRGFRGATETRDDLINRVQADLEYVSGWSLWRDIRILAATARVMLHRNAY